VLLWLRVLGFCVLGFGVCGCFVVCGFVVVMMFGQLLGLGCCVFLAVAGVGLVVFILFVYLCGVYYLFCFLWLFVIVWFWLIVLRFWIFVDIMHMVCFCVYCVLFGIVFGLGWVLFVCCCESVLLVGILVF